MNGDQAARLRELAQIGFKAPDVNAELKKPYQIITVTGGKGGVGKSNIALNLALALQLEQVRTLIFDADMGMANCDLLLGITPTYHLLHLLRGVASINEIVVNGPSGLKILPGGSGIRELVNITTSELNNLMIGFHELENDIDYVVIDTAAGAHESVRHFINLADRVVLVTTPEPTAMLDAYSLMKILSLSDHKPKFEIVVNTAKTEQEAKSTANAMDSAARRHLGIPADLLGVVSYDLKVVECVRKRTPFVFEYPDCNASLEIKAIARKILGSAEKPKTKGLWQRFLENLKV